MEISKLLMILLLILVLDQTKDILYRVPQFNIHFYGLSAPATEITNGLVWVGIKIQIEIIHSVVVVITALL